MARHVEHNPYAVRPARSRPGAGAKEGSRLERDRPFAELLAEAEAVRDAVRITVPLAWPAGAPAGKGAISAGLLVAAATGLWYGLSGGIGLPGRARRERVATADSAAAPEAPPGRGPGEG